MRYAGRGVLDLVVMFIRHQAARDGTYRGLSIINLYPAAQCSWFPWIDPYLAKKPPSTGRHKPVM